MIITALKGGLGNQMFQYALGRKLAHTDGTTLKLDIEGLDRANKGGDIYRPFALHSFAIQADIAAPAEIQRLKYPYGILSKLARRFRFKVLRQMHVGWEPEALAMGEGAYVDGYWQSYKYFEDIREVLLANFTLKESSPAARAVRARMQDASAVFVHVRRGDYVSNPNATATHGICSVSYYERAIAAMREQVPDAAWFLFSDDPAWAAEHLPFPSEPVIVSGTGLSDAEEMMLMTSASHAIIANSTFSWWGAWLIRNRDKIIVAPSPWSESRKDLTRDIIPPTWTLIPKN